MRVPLRLRGLENLPTSRPQHIRRVAVTPEPGRGVAAGRDSLLSPLAQQGDDAMHQAVRRALAAQGRRGFDMGNYQHAAMAAVIGESGQAIFNQFEARARHVVRDCVQTFTISLPRFRPANIPANADGILSKPSTTSTGAFNFPSSIHLAKAVSASRLRL